MLRITFSDSLFCHCFVLLLRIIIMVYDVPFIPLVENATLGNEAPGFGSACIIVFVLLYASLCRIPVHLSVVLYIPLYYHYISVKYYTYITLKLLCQFRFEYPLGMHQAFSASGKYSVVYYEEIPIALKSFANQRRGRRIRIVK